jgi:DNA polymerase III subunit gamma/tau
MGGGGEHCETVESIFKLFFKKAINSYKSWNLVFFCLILNFKFMATLYRKYRPQGFSELTGQNHIKITIEHEISTGKLAHAYLFCGPRGVGKTTLARLIAKSLNCEKKKPGEFEPCNNCASCENVSHGNDMDTIEIDAASHTGVDNVRENIIAVSRIAPSHAKFKVFIIDEVHMLSISAFNALLKVLEEPPMNVIFVLCTTEAHKIPNTIISRCERFDFKRMLFSDIVKRLSFIADSEKIKIEKGVLDSIARHSEGHMRDAIGLLGQIAAIGGDEITEKDADLVIPRSDMNEVMTMVEFVSQKDAAKAIELVNNLISDGVDLKRFTTDLVEVLRKLMLLKVNPGLSEKFGQELSPDMEARISSVATRMDLLQIIGAISGFSNAKNSLSASFIQQLPLEVAIINLCSAPVQEQNTKMFSANGASVPTDRNYAKPALTENKVIREQSPVRDADKVASTENEKKEISSRWNEVLAKIKKYNHSLSFILRVCEPRSVTGNDVCLAFKYKFHRDRLSDNGIRQIVEKVMEEVYGRRFSINAVIDENIQTGAIPSSSESAPPFSDDNMPSPEEESVPSAKIENDKVVDSLLKTFGGKIIN